MKEQIFDVTKTATVSEEFGPEQATHEMKAEATTAANKLLELYRRDPKAYQLALDLAATIVKELSPKS